MIGCDIARTLVRMHVHAFAIIEHSGIISHCGVIMQRTVGPSCASVHPGGISDVSSAYGK